MNRLLILAILALFICGGMLYAADGETDEPVTPVVEQPDDGDDDDAEVEGEEGEEGEGEEGEGEEDEGEEGEGEEGEEGETEEPAAAIDEIGADAAVGGPRVATPPPPPDIRWHILLTILPEPESKPEAKSFSEPREECPDPPTDNCYVGEPQ
ncbi:MAG: hypothetical protein JXA52_02895 [Planctomycetes bacterium]|nr:hypothetical protein [Planctomycetota bacterium]